MSSFYDEEKINEWEKFMKGENTRPDGHPLYERGQGTEAENTLTGDTGSGKGLSTQIESGQDFKVGDPLEPVDGNEKVDLENPGALNKIAAFCNDVKGGVVDYAKKTYLNNPNFNETAQRNVASRFGVSPEVMQDKDVFENAYKMDAARGDIYKRYGLTYEEAEDDGYMSLNKIDAMRETYERMPWLKKLGKDTTVAEAAAIFKDAKDLGKANGVYENFVTGGKRRWLEKEKSELLAEKFYGGELTEENKKRIEEIDEELATLPETQSLAGDVWGATFAQVGDTLAMMGMDVGSLPHNILTLGKMAAENNAGENNFDLVSDLNGEKANIPLADVDFNISNKDKAGAVYTGLGIGKGLVTGGVQKAVVGGIKNSMEISMFNMEVGDRFGYWTGIKDRNGNQYFSDDVARVLAAVDAGLQTYIEFGNFESWTKILTGVKDDALKKGLQEAFGKFKESKTAGKAAVWDLVKRQVVGAGKAGLGEAAEEGEQDLAENLLRQIAKHFFPESDIEEMGIPNMVISAAGNVLQALPSSFVLGLGGGITGTGAGIIKIRAQQENARKYGKDLVNDKIVVDVLQQVKTVADGSRLPQEMKEKMITAQAADKGLDKVYVDTNELQKAEGGQEVLNVLRQEAGEEQRSAEQATGTLVFSPAEMTRFDRETLDKVSPYLTGDVADECLAAIKNRAAELNERVRQAATVEAGKVHEAAESAAENIVGENTSPADMEVTREEQVGEVTGIVERYGERFKEGFDLEFANAAKERDRFVENYVRDLEKGAGQGVALVRTDDGKYIRSSNNDRWYGEYYRENGRAPSKAEMRQIVLDAFNGDNPYHIAEDEELAASKVVFDELNHRVEVLESVAQRVKDANPKDMAVARELSKEGKMVYDRVKDELQRQGRLLKNTGVINSAEAGAMMWALHADRMADAMNRIDPNRKFTAMDYFMQMNILYNQDLEIALSGKKGVVLNEEKANGLTDGYSTESGRPLEQADRNEYILRPDGSKAFGYISKEIEKATNGELVAGEIRLKVGDDKEGLIHANKHLKQIRYCGYNSVEDFVADTASGFDAIFRRTDKSGRISYNIVKLKKSDKEKNNVIGVALRIEKNDDGNYYAVLTAIPKKDKSLKREIKKEECVYCSPGIAATTFPNIGAVPTSAADKVGSGSDASPASDKHIPQFVDILTEDDSDVKQNKLIALHNISQEKLAKSLELGGLPMPSIAIMHNGNNFVNFGDITFVVPKEVVDPKNGADVFDKDAYTTRVPSPEYRSFKDKNLKPWVSKWVPIFKRFGKDRWFFDEIIYSLRNYADVSAIGKFFNNEIVKYYYLTDVLGLKVDLADNTDGAVYAAVHNEKYDKYFKDAKFSEWVQNETESFAGKPVLKVGGKYVDYNLENIVKAMKKKKGRGKETNVIYTNGTVAAMLSHKFKSIKDMHDYALELGTRAEMEQGKERSSSLVEAYCTGAVAYRDKGISTFDAYDEAMGCLADSVVKEKINKKRLKEKLEQAGLFKDVPDDVLDLGVEAGKALKETPTEYFEAKPARAVKFEEMTAAVVPDTANKDIVEKLKAKGIDVVIYESKKEGDRERALNDVLNTHPDVYFQKNRTIQGQSAVLQNGERFISLLKDADASTFFHETGHIFYEDLKRMSEVFGAPEYLRKDFATLDGWLAWTEDSLKEFEGTSGYAQMQEIDKRIRELTPQPQAAAPLIGGTRSGSELNGLLERWKQEKWARAVEEYVKDGRVPSEALGRILYELKKWLLQVYRAFRGAGVKMSDEVRAVMDRMLVSQEVVDGAVARREMESFKKAGGLDFAGGNAKEMWEKLFEEAREEAEAKVRRLALDDLQEKKQREMEEARKKERKAAEEMFASRPHFVVKAYMDANPRADLTVLCNKCGITPKEYEQRVAQDGGSVAAAVEKFMTETFEPILQKDNYASGEELRQKAEEALRTGEYHAILTAYESEILDKARRRFGRLYAKLLKEAQEKRKARRDAEKVLGKHTRPDGQGTPQPQQVAAAPLIGGTRSGKGLNPQPQAAGQIDKNDVIQLLNEIRDNKNIDSIAEEADFGENLGRLTKQGLLDKVKNWLHGIIGKEIVDPLGNKVQFVPQEGETEEHYALHLLAGKENKGVNDIEERRAKGALLAERTIKKPLVVVTQENGRKLYLSLYKNNNENIADQVVVAVDDQKDGVVVTTFSTIDKATKNTPISEIIRRVNSAVKIDYLRDTSRNNSASSVSTETSNGSVPYASAYIDNIADNEINVKDMTDLEKRQFREEVQKETIRQLKTELKNQKSATRRAALEVVRSCRRFAAEKMAELPLSQSANPAVWERLAQRAQDNVTREMNAFNLDEADAAKREQLVNETMAKEAAERQAKMARNNQRLKNKVAAMKKDKNVDYNYRYLYERVLWLFGFTGTMQVKWHKDYVGAFEIVERMKRTLELSGTDFGREDVRLPAFIEAVLRQDNPLVDSRVKGGFTSLTWDEYKQLSNFLDNVYVAGRNAKRICSFKDDTGKEILIEDLTDRITEESIKRNEVKGNGFANLEKAGFLDGVFELQEDLNLSLVKPERLLERLGPTAEKFLYQPLKRAADREDKMSDALTKRLGEILRRYREEKAELGKEEQTGGFYSKKLYRLNGQMITHEQLVAIGLNYGNVTNRKRVCDGYGLTDEEVLDALKELDSADWKLVEEFWQVFEDNYDAYNKVVMNTTGATLGKVEATPFAVMGVDGVLHKLKGGYYPIVFDPKKSSNVAQREQDEAARTQMSGAQRLGTGMGSSKERVKGDVFLPVDLSLDAGMRKMQEAIHAICFREVIRDLYKVVNHDMFKNACIGALGEKGYDAVYNWVLDSWKLESKHLDFWDNFMRTTRQNMTMGVLGFRLMTTLVNFANIPVAMHYTGAMRYLKSLLLCGANVTKCTDFVIANSVFMADRAETMDRDFREIAKKKAAGKVGGKKGAVKKFVNVFSAINDNAFSLMAMTDMMGSVPLWMAEYERVFQEGVDKGFSPEVCRQNAVDAGDKAVRQSYGSGREIDLASIQKGGKNRSEAVKAITMYYSYFNALYNMVYKDWHESRRNRRGGEKSWFRAYAPMIEGVLYLGLLQAMVEQAIRTFAGGDDEERTLKGYLMNVGSTIVSQVFGLVPIAREVGNGISRYMLGESVIQSRGMPALQAGDALMSLIKDVCNKVMTDKKITLSKVARDISGVIVPFTGFSKTVMDLIPTTLEFMENGDYTAGEFIEAAAFDRTLKSVHKENKK